MKTVLTGAGPREACPSPPPSTNWCNFHTNPSIIPCCAGGETEAWSSGPVVWEQGNQDLNKLVWLQVPLILTTRLSCVLVLKLNCAWGKDSGRGFSGKILVSPGAEGQPVSPPTTGAYSPPMGCSLGQQGDPAGDMSSCWWDHPPAPPGGPHEDVEQSVLCWLEWEHAPERSPCQKEAPVHWPSRTMFF